MHGVESLNKSTISGSRSTDSCIINYVRIIFIIVILLLLLLLALQPIVGFVFCSPLAGYSLLAYEVLDHTQRRATFGRTPLDE